MRIHTTLMIMDGRCRENSDHEHNQPNAAGQCHAEATQRPFTYDVCCMSACVRMVMLCLIDDVLW